MIGLVSVQQRVVFSSRKVIRLLDGWNKIVTQLVKVIIMLEQFWSPTKIIPWENHAIIGIKSQAPKGQRHNPETQHRFARAYYAWPSWLSSLLIWLVLCMKGEWGMWYSLTFMRFWTPCPTAFFLCKLRSEVSRMGLLEEY